MKKMTIKQALANRVKTQKVHLQDTPAVAMKPLTRGARLGPAKGPNVKIPRALPRVLGSQISDITALYSQWSAH